MVREAILVPTFMLQCLLIGRRQQPQPLRGDPARPGDRRPGRAAHAEVRRCSYARRARRQHSQATFWIKVRVGHFALLFATTFWEKAAYSECLEAARHTGCLQSNKKDCSSSERTFEMPENFNQFCCSWRSQIHFFVRLRGGGGS